MEKGPDDSQTSDWTKAGVTGRVRTRQRSERRLSSRTSWHNVGHPPFLFGANIRKGTGMRVRERAAQSSASH